MRGVASFMSEYGLWLIGAVIVIAVGGLVLRFFFDERKGETFQYVVILVLGVVFVPQAWVWVSDVSKPTPICPNFTSLEVQSCAINTVWSNWVTYARPEDSGYRLCLSLGVLFERRLIQGAAYWRFKAPDGVMVVKYGVYPPQTDCANVNL